MQETLQALLRLQETDRKIFRVESELRRLPEELANRQAELDRAKSELEELNRHLHELRGRIKEIEDITTVQRQRLRKLESEATKTKTDGALLAAYDHEIRALKRTISQAEEDGLLIVGKVEEIEHDITARESRLAEMSTVFAAFQANVERETAAAETKLADLNAEQEHSRAHDIQPQHVELYRRLLATREGEAMAELQGQICQGCYVEIPKNLAVRLARGNELVQCQSCARILYAR